MTLAVTAETIERLLALMALLEQRNALLEQRNVLLEQENAQLRARVAELERRLAVRFGQAQPHIVEQAAAPVAAAE